MADLGVGIRKNAARRQERKDVAGGRRQRALSALDLSALDPADPADLADRWRVHLPMDERTDLRVASPLEDDDEGEEDEGDEGDGDDEVGALASRPRTAAPPSAARRGPSRRARRRRAARPAAVCGGRLGGGGAAAARVGARRHLGRADGAELQRRPLRLHRGRRRVRHVPDGRREPPPLGGGVPLLQEPARLRVLREVRRDAGAARARRPTTSRQRPTTTTGATSTARLARASTSSSAPDDGTLH